MTAWYDLPSPTRRQARNNERGADAATPVESAETPDFTDVKQAHVKQGDAKLIESNHHEPTHKSTMQSSDTSHTAAPTDLDDSAAEPNQYTGFPREVWNASDQAGTPPARPRTDLSAGYGRRAQRTTEQLAAVQKAAEQPAGEQSFRPRNYSPEARRQSFSTTQGFPATPASPDQSSASGGELGYFTQATPLVRTAQSSEVESAPVAVTPPAKRPMTRRELRELETRQGLRPATADKASEPTPRAEKPVAPAELPTVAMPIAPKPVAVPTIFAAPVAPAPVSPAPIPAAPASRPPISPALPTPLQPPVSSSPFRADAPAQPAALRPAPIASAPVPAAPISSVPISIAPVPISIAPVPLAEAAASATGQTGAIPHPLQDAIAAADRGVDLAPQVFNAPIAAWPAAAPVSEVPAAFSQPFARTSGGGLTTNALVIPSIPHASDLSRPFNTSTGEILVTGSIDLPRSLSSTGAHPSRFDHSDIDALFASEDTDYASSDSAPVRAIRAVSTHTSTHGVISAKKPTNSRLPMIMAITAGVLAVAVAALFAAGLIFGYL